MKTIIRFLCMALLPVLAACTHTNPPVNPTRTYATEFTFGQLEDYGVYYAEEGLMSRVIALDLYSDGLKLNKKGYMEGSGTNLYFSDIFLPASDSLSLLAGYPNYPDTAFLAADSGEPFTFLPGTYYEGNFTGAYILLVDSGALSSYTLVPTGTLTLRTEGDTTHLHLQGTISSGKTYEASYVGVLRKVRKTQKSRKMVR